MNRRIFKAAIGLLAAGTAVGLMSLPASANTMTFTIDGGSINLYNADDTLVDSITLGGTTGCGTSQTSITATDTGPTSGTIFGTLSASGPVKVIGVDLVSTFTATITGTYEYIGNGTYTIDVNISASVTLDPATGTGSCTKSATIDCSIFVSNIPVTGVYSGTLPTMVSGDTAQLSGNSGPFAISVAPGCPGPLSAINDGSATIDGLFLTAI